MTRHLRHRPRAAHQHQQPDEDLAMLLARDHIAAGDQPPVPRAPLSRRASSALWALRVFVIILSAMVIYTFVAQLGH
jgi:hypothetical protein